MAEISNKTLAILSALSLIVLLIGILSSSQYGIASITGLGIRDGSSFSDISVPITILITVIINVILLIILLKNKNY